MTFDEFVSEIKNCEYFEDVFSTGNIDLYWIMSKENMMILTLLML